MTPPTASEADELLAAYQVDRSPLGDRPWVLANMVSSIDGSTAAGGRVGALSSPADRQLFLDLRSVADFVLVGAETVRRERYGPVRLRPELRTRRSEMGLSPTPRLAVVSGSLDLDLDLPFLSEAHADAPPVVLTTASAPTTRRATLAGVAEVVEAGDDELDVALALRLLRQRGARVVLCEGGPTLLGWLFAASVVDELCLTVAPMVGGDPLPVTVRPSPSESPPAPGSPSLTPARLAHAIARGDDVFLRYEFR